MSLSLWAAQAREVLDLHSTHPSSLTLMAATHAGRVVELVSKVLHLNSVIDDMDAQMAEQDAEVVKLTETLDELQHRMTSLEK